jgi:hypothetical protein
VDLPVGAQAAPDATPPPQPAGGCLDQINATVNGDPKVLGFPISYATTIVGEDGKPNVVAMDISELEITNLDAALFDVPPGMAEAGNLQALTKAVSDASESKLAESLKASAPPAEKTPGMALVGVPEIANKTNQQVDTRALRGRLVSELAELNLNAAPLAAAPDVAQQAGAHGYDYVLVAEITDLKVSKGGGIGGALRAATKVAGVAGSSAEPAEAAITVRLVQPDGKARYTTTVKGKTGAGLDMKTGLGVAKFVGTGYLNFMTGRFMMNALNQQMASNLGGMGALNNPSLLNMQTRGLGMTGGLRGGLGIDMTANAASFLMQQSMASNTLTSGLMGSSAASFEEALGDALKNAAKSVSDNLKKK